MNKLKFLKITFHLFLVLSLFFPYVSRAEWVDFDGASNAQEALDRILSSSNQEKIFSSVENRYGFNQDIWRTAKRKVTAPRVEIFFDNTNPKPGEKVTAHAVPEFFKNDPQNLYYTWHLIHTRDGNIKTATNSVDSGIREASKIMSRGDYDPDLEGQDYGDKDEDPDKDGWPAVDNNSYNACLENGDEDNSDCAFAPMGGADGVGGLNEKTTEQYSDADTYCRSLGDPDADQCSYYVDSGSEKVYTPSIYYYTLQSNQTNYYCQECQNSLTMPAEDCSTARNKCCYSVANPADTYYESFDISTDYCPATYSSSYDSCYQSFASCNQSDVAACISQKFSQCETDWAAAHQSNNEEIVVGVSRCYKHKFGTNFDASSFRATDDSGLDYPVSCRHKWKDASGYKSGSGKFSTGEEEYWKTDPLDPDTDGDGFSDEADVIGLGNQDFTWTYQAGDRIGVVVEGTSMLPTDEKNAYYKIMWGYPDVCDATKTNLMNDDQCEDSGDYGFGFLATKAPGEEGEEKLKVSLSFSPDSPVADPSNDNKDNIRDDGTILDADQVTVISSLDNTDNNPGNLYYTWQISKGSLEEDSWKEITNLKDNFSLDTPSSGMGLSQFSFAPKKDALSGNEDIVYFKVTLTVSQASDVKAGRGRSSVVVPYNKNGVKITLHKVNIADGKATIGDEVCNEGLYASLCPAIQGQMLAAKVSGGKYKAGNAEFSWKINDNPLYPPADASSTFDGWNSTSVFFPVTKEEQEIEEISVTATPEDKLQPVTGGRFITVVHPAVFIRSADTSTAWPITYTAEDPNAKESSVTIESSSAFNALTSSNATFYLDFVPYYLLGDDADTQIDWLVNGTSIFSTDFYIDNPDLGLVELGEGYQTIKIPTSSNEGVYYNLSAEVKKYWSDEEQGIAYAAWGVSPQALEGEGSATISTTAYPPFAEEETSLGKSKQILAAIGDNLPHYFMYLLRLVITMAVMFFASSVLYGLTRRLSPDYEKE